MRLAKILASGMATLVVGTSGQLVDPATTRMGMEADVMNGPEIVAVMREITNGTDKLTAALDGWSGSLFGAVPLDGIWKKLLQDLARGAKVAEASQPLTSPETIILTKTTVVLSASVGQTMDSLVGAKPKFDKLKLANTVADSLKKEHAAADKMGDAILDKVPALLQTVAEGLIDGVLAHFQEAIEAYGGSVADDFSHVTPPGGPGPVIFPPPGKGVDKDGGEVEFGRPDGPGPVVLPPGGEGFGPLLGKFFVRLDEEEGQQADDGKPKEPEVGYGYGGDGEGRRPVQWRA